MVSFRDARKLNCHLVRAKVYPFELKFGSCACDKKRCILSVVLPITLIRLSSV